MGARISTFSKIFLVWLIILISVSLADAQISQRVINGSNAQRDYPWMASVGTANLPPGRGHFCGAVIVDRKFAATAAHCMEGLETNPEIIQLFVGKSHLNDTSANVAFVDGVIIHPDYNPETQQSDIALLRLTEPLDESSVIPTLTLQEEASLGAGSNAILLGWGTTDASLSVRPLTLQEATIPLVDSATCLNRIGLDFDSETMLCGGILSSTAQGFDGTDACYGDSGGPLVIQTPNGYRLLGLASWGFSCASEKYWGVYSRIAPYSAWIAGPHTIAPYQISVPSIDGIPKVRSKIVCDGGVYGGDPLVSKNVIIQDAETGQVLKRGSTYELKNSDVGRSISCKAVVANQGGQLEAESDSVGPVFPASSSAIKFSRGSVVRSASLSCSNGKCAMLLAFKKAQVGLRFLFEGATSTCHSSKCPNRNWKNASKVTPKAWAISLPRNWREYSGVLIRSVGVDKRSLLSEADF